MRIHARYKKGDLHFPGSQINFSRQLDQSQPEAGIKGKDHEEKIMRELLFG